MTNRAPDPDSAIPISALQHYLFCARQCTLIHVERIWTENVYTAEGRALHETADKPSGRVDGHSNALVEC